MLRTGIILGDETYHITEEETDKEFKERKRKLTEKDAKRLEAKYQEYLYKHRRKIKQEEENEELYEEAEKLRTEKKEKEEKELRERIVKMKADGSYKRNELQKIIYNSLKQKQYRIDARNKKIQKFRDDMKRRENDIIKYKEKHKNDPRPIPKYNIGENGTLVDNPRYLEIKKRGRIY